MTVSRSFIVRVAPAVDWVHCNSYMTGYPNGTFRPDLDITRAQTTRLTCRANTQSGTC